MDRCHQCGYLGQSGADPHPDRDSCPFDDPTLYDSSPDGSLLEAIKNTIPSNSVALRGWGESYPVFRTVAATRMWVPTSDDCTVDNPADGPYWKKEIKTVPNDGAFYRIEYDPNSPALIEWYKETDGSREFLSSDFRAYLRNESANVSYFGAVE